MGTVLPNAFEEPPAPRTHEELALLVLDFSGSMAEREQRSGMLKAEAVIHHLLREPPGENPRSGSLLARLHRSRNRDAFWIAVLVFSNRVEQVLAPTPLSQVDPQSLPLDPRDLLNRFGDTTAIGRALQEADRIAQAWLAGAEPDLPRFVTILLMSDGCETANTDPLGVARQIHARAAGSGSPRPSIVIAAAAYGEDADEKVLRAIASPRPDGSPMFARVRSGAELRDFFIASLTTQA